MPSEAAEPREGNEVVGSRFKVIDPGAIDRDILTDHLSGDMYRIVDTKDGERVTVAYANNWAFATFATRLMNAGSVLKDATESFYRDQKEAEAAENVYPDEDEGTMGS